LQSLCLRCPKEAIGQWVCRVWKEVMAVIRLLKSRRSHLHTNKQIAHATLSSEIFAMNVVQPLMAHAAVSVGLQRWH
jgi:hypothetical protein